MDDDPTSAVGEKIQGYITLAITIAARVIEVYAHRRQQQLEEARRQSEAYGRQVEAQQRAQAVAARFDLRPATRPEWWDKATPEQAAAAYATARAYGQHDDELAGMARYMGDQIERRYGVNPDQLVAREEQRAADARQRAEYERQVAAETARSTEASAAEEALLEAELVRYDDVLDKLPEHLREEFSTSAPATENEVELLLDRIERGAGLPPGEQLPRGAEQRAAQQQRARAETAEATALLAEANGIDGAVRADGVVDGHERWHDVPVANADWDGAARHETLSARLAAAMPDQPEAVQARMTVDAAQAKPAAAATGAKPAAKAPRARNTPVKGAERVVGR